MNQIFVLMLEICNANDAATKSYVDWAMANQEVTSETPGCITP